MCSSNARFIVLFMLNKIYNWLYETVYGTPSCASAKYAQNGRSRVGADFV